MKIFVSCSNKLSYYFWVTEEHLPPVRDYSISKKTLAVIATAFIYFILGWFCLRLATINDNTSPFWLPSGFATGALFYFGRWLTPGIFLGAFLVNLTISSPGGSFIFAIGNTLEAFIGSSILLVILKKDSFKNYSELLSLLTAAIISPLFSASFGTFALHFYEHLELKDIGYSWFTWWSGDFVGILVLTPLALYWSKKTKESSANWQGAVIFVICLLSYVSYIFFNELNQAFAWSVCPFLILAGGLFGNLISRIILIILSLAIVALTKIGHGPFEYGNVNLNLIFMQSLLICYSISTLFVRLFESEIRLSRKFLVGLTLSWCCVFMFIFSTSSIEKKHLVDDLKKTVNESIESLDKTLAVYNHLIESGKALFVVNPDITAAEWRRFTETIHLEQEYSAINGFGFIKYSLKDKDPNPNVKYWDKEFSKQFKDQFIITYLEPYDKNHMAIGFDIGSDPLRRKTAEASMKKKLPGLSAPIKLVQDPEQRRSFAIYNPIWLPKEKRFVGWIVAPVISKVFFESSLDSFSDVLKITVSYDGKVVHELGKPLNKNRLPNTHIKKSVLVFDQKYDFDFYPTTLFLRRHVGFTIPLALLLNIFMLFVTGFFIEQLSFGQKSEKLVRMRTKELEESKIQLIHSSKMASLGEMAGGMAHEINNPLTIIQGKVKILSLMVNDEKPDKAMIEKEIDKIMFTTERISKIVRGLRTFSRVSDNDPFEVMPLSVVFKETLDLCAEKFKFNGVELQIAPIPPVDIDCKPSQISQVLLNLFNNANDAVEELSEKWIQVGFSQANGMIKIYITDSGLGISPEISQRIMEPFFTTKEVGKGTGLGLSITKGIIEAHKGKFTYNADSHHTQFIIELPIQV